MKVEVILPIIISFAISAVLCPIVIPFLKRLKFGQPIRQEGPKEHLKKSGTPVMGGIVFLIGIIITSLIYLNGHKNIAPILFVTLGFGLIGFLDDFIKVVMKNPKGLLPWQKMLGQLLVTGIFALYLLKFSDVSTEAIIPFTGGKTIDMGIFFLPVFFFIVLGTVNGANFTDGLDGLCTSVTLLIAVFFTMIAIATNAGIQPVTGAVVGGLMGFLLFNVHPAKVFMGDTGSLALGGFVVATAYMLQLPLFLPMIALIYMVEILSVIIQVTYFKKTGGKRIFKMSPIHHHFELCGWSETRVVAVFSIVTTIMCLCAYLAL
ncbi:MAG: phospho-N-acetylmuramoyl-pentapeptide-transferase [Lachnospiraceae bacterium]|nr:phospho-N-acetylmuramoyl-pentapeptide-transferase [Lachnospiraceae bacterium]